MSRTTIRKPGPERREQIASAALRIIGRLGPSGVTTAGLAEAVGLTPGALFRHFKTLDAILDEAVRVAESQVEATFPEATLPPLERLRRLAHARVELLSKEPAIAWLLRSGEARSALSAPAAKRLRGLVRRSRACIQTALTEAVAEGRIRSDVPLDGLLLVYTSTVHALIGQPGARKRGPGRMPPAAAVDALMTLLAPSETKKTRR